MAVSPPCNRRAVRYGAVRVTAEQPAPLPGEVPPGRGAATRVRPAAAPDNRAQVGLTPEAVTAARKPRLDAGG